MRWPRHLCSDATLLLLLGAVFLPCRGASGADPELIRQKFDQPSAIDQSPAIKMLKQIEDRVLPLPLVDGDARNESLSDYYWDANRALKYQLDEAVRAFTSGKPTPFRALTVVAGSAGVGKTFVKRGVFGSEIPEEQVWKFDLRELFGEFANQGLAEWKPDVVYQDQVMNRLLALTPEGREEFARLLESKSPAFAVADSLDEIHPDDYSFVLDELEQFALRSDRQFIHVVVFGRPFAFREYWQERRTSGLPDGLRGFVLNPPDFRTTGDLCVSNWNHDSFKYGLSRVGSDGESRPIPFSDYQQWSNQNFPTTGEFSDFRFKESRCTQPDLRDELKRLTSQSRVVMGVFPNLAGNSILREIVEFNLDAKKSFNEREFMDEFFAKWLERDTATDNRPSRIQDEHLDIYLKLLEAVAAKYIDEDRVDRYGYFEVFEDDRVVVQHDDETVSVPASQLLNRSGLVTLDPAFPIAQRYRFEPLWIHRLLLQTHLEREMDRELQSPSTGVPLAR